VIELKEVGDSSKRARRRRRWGRGVWEGVFLSPGD